MTSNFRRSRARAAADPAAPVLTLVVDSREQLAYNFTGLVPVVARALPAGDYSILGHESTFALERKSLADLFSTVIGDRDRFERELERLRGYAFAAILVEGSLRDVLEHRPPPTSAAWSRLSPAQIAAQPRAVVNSLNTYQIEYGIRVLYVDKDRDLCRAQVLRLAERFWRARLLEQDKKAESAEAPTA